MMKLTIGSEAIFFLSLIVAYLYFWRSGNFQTAAASYLHVKTTGLFTVALLSSSFSFWKAEQSFKRDKERSLIIWLGITIGLGIIFLVGQGREYYNLISEQLTINKSEFGSSFYTLTGFHGLHVLVGLIVLTIVLLLCLKGLIKRGSSTVLHTVGLYWHFVDAVWIIVFTTIYLLPYLM